MSGAGEAATDQVTLTPQRGLAGGEPVAGAIGDARRAIC